MRGLFGASAGKEEGRRTDAMADSKVTDTQHVLDHVKRAETALYNFHRDGTTSDGVLRNAKIQSVALKVARDELSKAIAILEHHRWR